MKIGKLDWIMISGFIVLGLLAIFFYFYPQYGVWLDFSTWAINKDFLGETLLIVFTVCVIGNLLPFPTPYAFIIIPAALNFPSFFWLIGLVAALGALIGESGGYLVGRAGNESLKRSNRNIEKIEDWKLLINKRPRLVMFLIFLFGLTPLNDDNIMIPIGLAGFDFKRTVFSCFLGKLGMMMLLAVGGAFGISWLESLAGSGEASTTGWIEGLIIIAITLVIIWIMFKIDIKRFLKEKYGVEELKERTESVSK